MELQLADYVRRFSMTDSENISSAAEARIESEFLLRDIEVWHPSIETQHDLLAYFDNDYQKVQVKHARYREDDGVVDIHTTSWGCSGSEYEDRRDYSADEVDYFAGYCSELDSCFLVPFEDAGKTCIWIRVDETEINDSRINWATDYEIDEFV
jgi:hypothetical protein